MVITRGVNLNEVFEETAAKYNKYLELAKKARKKLAKDCKAILSKKRNSKSKETSALLKKETQLYLKRFDEQMKSIEEEVLRTMKKFHAITDASLLEKERTKLKQAK